MKQRNYTLALLSAIWLAGSTAWAHDGDHTYSPNGICTIDGCTDQYQPATLNSGWYELRNAGNIEWFGVKIADAATDAANGGKKFNVASYKMLNDIADGLISVPSQDSGGYYKLTNAIDIEWFSQQVAKGGDANLQIKGKLMNDIDFLGIGNLHSPIGPTTAYKYNGTFDGQGYRIKNMIIKRPNDNNIGFFGFLRGDAANTTVKNLIIDKSCYIHGNNRVGGITGSCQNSSSFTITLENIINEATVIADHQDAAFMVHQWSCSPTLALNIDDTNC